MQSADLTIQLPEWMQLPVPDYAADETVRREEVLSWRVYSDDGVVGFLSLVVGDLEAARKSAADLDPLRNAEFAPVDDDTFYAYAEMDLREADASLMGTFADRGLVVVPPIVYTDADTVHVTVLGEESSLSGLLERFPDDVEVSVDRISDHQHRAGSLAGRLTDRQFEALEVAREVGYYEVPRDGALAEVAAALDCSEAAASTLLRKAEAALVDAALGH
ncbi:helix-turn-helix domain-containing protein [Halobacteriales archaeon Cl-PHB]